jgi:hypothetical protein
MDKRSVMYYYYKCFCIRLKSMVKREESSKRLARGDMIWFSNKCELLTVLKALKAYREWREETR